MSASRPEPLTIPSAPKTINVVIFEDQPVLQGLLRKQIELRSGEHKGVGYNFVVQVYANTEAGFASEPLKSIVTRANLRKEILALEKKILALETLESEILIAKQLIDSKDVSSIKQKELASALSAKEKELSELKTEVTLNETKLVTLRAQLIECEAKVKEIEENYLFLMDNKLGDEYVQGIERTKALREVEKFNGKIILTSSDNFKPEELKAFAHYFNHRILKGDGGLTDKIEEGGVQKTNIINSVLSDVLGITVTSSVISATPAPTPTPGSRRRASSSQSKTPGSSTLFTSSSGLLKQTPTPRSSRRPTRSGINFDDLENKLLSSNSNNSLPSVDSRDVLPNPEPMSREVSGDSRSISRTSSLQLFPPLEPTSMTRDSSDDAKLSRVSSTVSLPDEDKSLDSSVLAQSMAAAVISPAVPTPSPVVDNSSPPSSASMPSAGESSSPLSGITPKPEGLADAVSPKRAKIG